MKKVLDITKIIRDKILILEGANESQRDKAKLQAEIQHSKERVAEFVEFKKNNISWTEKLAKYGSLASVLYDVGNIVWTAYKLTTPTGLAMTFSIAIAKKLVVNVLKEVGKKEVRNMIAKNLVKRTLIGVGAGKTIDEITNK